MYHNTTIYTSFNCSFKPAMDFGAPESQSRHAKTSSRCNDLCSLVLTSSSLFRSLALQSTSPSRSQEPCCNVYTPTQQIHKITNTNNCRSNQLWLKQLMQVHAHTTNITDCISIMTSAKMRGYVFKYIVKLQYY